MYSFFLFLTEFKFTTHQLLFQSNLNNATVDMSESDEDSDEMPEQDIRNLSDELKFDANEMVRHDLWTHFKKKRSQQSKHFVIAKIDEVIGFIVDGSTAQLISSVNKQFQVT